MARYTCIICGCGHDGINCPICTLREQARESDDRAARAQEKASREMSSAIAEQTERLAEQMARTREAEAEAALQAQMLMEDAAEEHRAAVAQSVEQHRQNTANAWRLEAQSKCDRARTLYDSGLINESLRLALQALEQDPGNINAALLAAECQASTEQKAKLLSRAVQMLSMPEYRWQRDLFATVLSKVQAHPDLVAFYFAQVERSVSYWEASGSLIKVHEFARQLIEVGRPDLAVRSLGGLLVTPNLSPDTLSCIRTILQGAVQEINALVQCSNDIQNIINALEPRTRIGPKKLPENSVRQALITLAYELEFEILIGTQSERIAPFFATIEFKERDQLSAALLELRIAVDQGKLNKGTLSSLIEAAKRKYTLWQPVIEREILDRAKARTKTFDIHPLPTAVVWFLVLTVGEGVYARVPQNTSMIAYLVGVLVGTILFNTMTLLLIDRLQIYVKMRGQFDESAKEENKFLDLLGLPPISNGQSRLRSPLIDAAVCIVLACAFLIVWQKFIHQNPSAATKSVTQSKDVFAAMYPWYLDSINRTMNVNGYKSLADPHTRHGARAYLSFDIARDGSVSKIRLTSTSGSPSWDKACLTAAKHVDKFSPLPSNYAEKSLTVSYYCEY